MDIHTGAPLAAFPQILGGIHPKYPIDMDWVVRSASHEDRMNSVDFHGLSQTFMDSMMGYIGHDSGHDEREEQTRKCRLCLFAVPWIGY